MEQAKFYIARCTPMYYKVEEVEENMSLPYNKLSFFHRMELVCLLPTLNVPVLSWVLLMFHVPGVCLSSVHYRF